MAHVHGETDDLALTIWHHNSRQAHISGSFVWHCNRSIWWLFLHRFFVATNETGGFSRVIGMVISRDVRGAQDGWMTPISSYNLQQEL